MDTKMINTLSVCRRELEALRSVYKMPATEMANFGARSEWVCSEFFSRMEAEYESSIPYSLGRRIEKLLGAIREIRGELKSEVMTNTFDDRLCVYLAKATSRLRHRFINWENPRLDVRGVGTLRSQLPEHGGEEMTKEFAEDGFAFRVRGTDHKWHRGTLVNVTRADVWASPKATFSVQDHWFSWRTSQAQHYVMNATPIEGHVLNKQGITVYRLKCLALHGSELSRMDAYLCESTSMHNQNRDLIFAHGKDTATAHSLLKRRIKSETLKRLDI